MKKTESKWFSPILARVWGFSDTTKKKGVQKWRFFFAPNEVWWYNAVTAGAVGRAKKWKIGIVIAIMEENMFWWQKIMWIFFLEVFRKKVGKIFWKKIFLGPIHSQNLPQSEKFCIFADWQGISKASNTWREITLNQPKKSFNKKKNEMELPHNVIYDINQPGRTY